MQRNGQKTGKLDTFLRQKKGSKKAYFWCFSERPAKIIEKQSNTDFSLFVVFTCFLCPISLTHFSIFQASLYYHLMDTGWLLQGFFTPGFLFLQSLLFIWSAYSRFRPFTKGSFYNPSGLHAFIAHKPLIMTLAADPSRTGFITLFSIASVLSYSLQSSEFVLHILWFDKLF